MTGAPKRAILPQLPQFLGRMASISNEKAKGWLAPISTSTERLWNQCPLIQTNSNHSNSSATVTLLSLCRSSKVSPRHPTRLPWSPMASGNPRTVTFSITRLWLATWSSRVCLRCTTQMLKSRASNSVPKANSATIKSIFIRWHRKTNLTRNSNRDSQVSHQRSPQLTWHSKNLRNKQGPKHNHHLIPF